MYIISSPLTIFTLVLGGLMENCVLMTLGSAKASQEPHPCASVSCYYNAMCVVDPDTNLGFCDCPTSECDTFPYSPVCADGITFNSPCHAQMYMCTTQRDIKLHHGGVCNSSDCGPTNPCSLHGVCIEGSCKCVSCNNTNFQIDGLASASQSVCGSNGVRYDSECLMEYESCLSRKVIKVTKASNCAEKSAEIKPSDLRVEHLRIWISGIESQDKRIDEHDDEITSRHTRGTVHVCQSVELRGCLPLSHPRKQYLGTYTINRGSRRFDSPVYKRTVSVRTSAKSVYLSRFKSAEVINGSWIVGSQVGNGRGWFGVSDSASDPRNISGIWYSTSGLPDRPWKKELTVRLHCLGDKLKRKHSLRECISDEVTGTHEINSKNGTNDLPFYQLKLTNSAGGTIETYRPGERVKVIVRHSDRNNRFNTIYLVMRNEVDECGVPGLLRPKKRFTSGCYGQMILRHARRMGKVKMHFNMPLRGCVTFNVLLKSTKDEVFYDFSTPDDRISKHLTKRLCPNSERVD